MPRQLWIADVLRAAGLPVIEVSGWKSRGSEDYDPDGLLAHDTGSSSRTTSDAGEISVMITGRAGLPGPIAQVYLSRTGIWHVVTAGRSNHCLTGWGGPYKGLGNRRMFGIEAQHADGEPWSEVQYRSYVRGVAAILKHTGWPTVAGHKEHQPGAKVDPSFDMDQFRRDVAAVTESEKTMILVRLKGDPTGRVWIADGITRRWVSSPAELAAIQAAGKAGRLTVANAGGIIDVPAVEPYGRDVAELGSVTVALSAEDRSAITAEVAAAVAASLAGARVHLDGTITGAQA